MLYTKTTLSLDINISNDDLSEATQIKVVVKTKSSRYEKIATITGPGTCSVIMTSDETADSGNYYVQPIIIKNTNEFPGNVRMFSLQDRI